MFSEGVRVGFLIQMSLGSRDSKLLATYDGQWRCGGSEFQTLQTTNWAAIEKLRLPSLVILVRRTNRSLL